MNIVTPIEVITAWAGRLGALLIPPLIVALVYEVFSRYVLNTPTLWAFEVSYMVMGAIFMLGMANALREGQHVHVDVITLRLPPRVIGGIQVVTYLCFLPLVIWLTWELFQYFAEALDSGERSGRSAWNPVVWPAYGTWFVGFSLLSLQLLAELLKSLRVVVVGEERRHG